MEVELKEEEIQLLNNILQNIQVNGVQTNLKPLLNLLQAINIPIEKDNDNE